MDMNLNKLKAQAKALTGWKYACLKNSEDFRDRLIGLHKEVSLAVEENIGWGNRQEIAFGKGEGAPLPLGMPVVLGYLLLKVLALCQHYDIDIAQGIEEIQKYEALRDHSEAA